MKGEVDELVQPEQNTEVGSVDEANSPLPMSGGKALIRLLDILQREGLDTVASESIDMAVAEEARPGIAQALADVTASPSEKPMSDVLAGVPGAPSRAERTRDGEEPALAQAFADAVADLGPPTSTGPQWRSLGPWTIPNGQTYGSSRVNVSGRVSCVSVDPANAAHVLVGAAQGGVWESFNRGASWSPRTDYAETLAVGALVFDPSDARTVYCGLGEGDFYWWLGRGILRSTDGGTTWATHCTAPFVGQGFHTLKVDRSNRNRLISGTTHGLYVSTDAGLTWTRRRTQRTWVVSWAPSGVATAEILAACADGVVRSVDGGTTWTAQALPGAPATFDRLAVSIAPSSPGIAYAWGSRANVPYLYRRAGGTWTAVGAPPGVAVNQAWYDWFLDTAPDNANQIYCGAIEVHRGDLSGTTWTWRNLTNKGTTGQSIHPDQHAIAFEPGNANSLYIGNDGGLFRSPDRGLTWQHCNNGLVISEFEYLAQDFGSSRWLLGGTQDNGTQRWTGSSTMEHVADGDGGDCGVNRTSPTTVFHTYFNMTPELSTTKGNWASWTWVFPPVPAGEGSLFYPPFETSATTGDTIAMGGDALYVSRNNGTAWTRLAFPAASRSSAMAIPHPNEVYVGATNGRVFRTTWNGATWTPSRRSRRRAPTRTSATCTRGRAAPAWVTIVPQSTAAGSSLRRCRQQLDRPPACPHCRSMPSSVDSANPNRAWVGADVGVYQTFDAGATWAPFANALPNSMIGDLVLHPHARVLRAGTRNRGIWEIPVDGWQTQPWNGVQFIGPLAANASNRWFTFNWPATWHVLWTVMPMTVRPGAPQLSWTVQVERASAEYVTYWITVRNLTPSAVTFEGRFAVLSRY